MGGTKCNLKVDVIIDFNIMVLLYKISLPKIFYETFGLTVLNKILDGIVDCVFMAAFLLLSILSVVIAGLR